MKNTRYGLIAFLLVIISQNVSLADSPGERIARAIEDFDSGNNISFEGPLENGLMQAIRDNNCAQAIEYLEKGANPNIRDGFGRTFLHILAYYKKVTPIAKALLDKGADPNSKRNDLYTPLHSAVYEGNQEIIQLLLKNKADIDAKNNIGDTPLHMAVARGKVEIVKLLLDAGANPHVTNNWDGASPLHHIIEGVECCYDVNSKKTKIIIKKGIEIAQLLLTAGAKKDAKTEIFKDTPYDIVRNWFEREECEMDLQIQSSVKKLMNLLHIEPLKSSQ